MQRATIRRETDDRRGNAALDADKGSHRWDEMSLKPLCQNSLRDEGNNAALRAFVS